MAAQCSPFYLVPQVQWLRTQFPSLDIEVDGGVGPDTIHKCAEVRGCSRASILSLSVLLQKIKLRRNF